MSDPLVTMGSLAELAREISGCEACPRLRRHCQTVAQEKRRAYELEDYWGRPVTGFGDPRARLIVIGLAPAAHGANRTGRIFTGDRSGDWLYRALHKSGFANQPQSIDKRDGLKLLNAWVTCVARCAPPDNKPMPVELERCSHFLEREVKLLVRARVYVALGAIALQRAWPILSAQGVPNITSDRKKISKPRFAHGSEVPLEGGRTLIMSYHPSQQNTFTGRLTEPMFDSVFERARNFIDQPPDR